MTRFGPLPDEHAPERRVIGASAHRDDMNTTLSGWSPSARRLMKTDDTPMAMAEATANQLPTLSSIMPGRRITSAPSKPDARWRPSGARARSRRGIALPRQWQTSGARKLIAVTSPTGDQRQGGEPCEHGDGAGNRPDGVKRTTAPFAGERRRHGSRRRGASVRTAKATRLRKRPGRAARPACRHIACNDGKARQQRAGQDHPECAGKSVVACLVVRPSPTVIRLGCILRHNGPPPPVMLSGK